MEQLIKKHSSKIRFIIVGVANTLIDLGVLFFVVSLGIDKIPGNYISSTVALAFSFFANRSFTFKSKSSAKKQFLPFLIITLVGPWIIQPIVIFITLSPIESIVNNNNIALLITKILATAIALVWNYLLYSKLVFKGDNSGNNQPKS